VGETDLSGSKSNHKSICHYFVDAVADAVIFDRKGRAITGSEGCSRYFIRGIIDIANPNALTKDLND